MDAPSLRPASPSNPCEIDTTNFNINISPQVLPNPSAPADLQVPEHRETCCPEIDACEMDTAMDAANKPNQGPQLEETLGRT